MNLTDLVDNLKGVGPSLSPKLNQLGINTIGDLLLHAPVRYVDSSNIVKIAELNREEKKTTRVTVLSFNSIRIRGGKSLQRAKVSDGDDEIEAIWFNQPYLKNALKVDSEYLLYGKLHPSRNQLIAPEYESYREDATHLGRITPIYKRTAGISAKKIRTLIKHVCDDYLLDGSNSDILPVRIRDKYKLKEFKEAIFSLHFPASYVEAYAARKRLAFDELLGIQFKLLEEHEKRITTKAPKLKLKPDALNTFLKSLPFSPTQSQMDAFGDVCTDLQKGYPMNRLIQGDVGSGKTLVAMLAGLVVLNDKKQLIVLCPTSVLAKQHFESFSRFLPDFSIELVTGANKKAASAQILISTHAILHRLHNLVSNLGMLIIDEQHKFGVMQREAINNFCKKTAVHVLNLTATPIPRTLALSLFGNNDISIITPPTNRLPVTTHVVPEKKRADSIKWINEQAQAGNKVFWVFPLIEEDDDNKSVKQSLPILQKHFKGLNIAILHGKMKAQEKNEAITEFANGKTNILLSTTVIEVGIDIASANLIVIERAEQFGLAQLHQLRGRVGRAGQQAYCLLYIGNENNIDAVTRLQYFAKENDGIKIAEFDLEQRGPGEVYGTLQSGIPSLKVASFSNKKLLTATREAALELYPERDKVINSIFTRA